MGVLPRGKVRLRAPIGRATAVAALSGAAGAAVRQISGRHLWPAIGIALCALLAYAFTLATFLNNLTLDTPLAYLPLLPLIAVWASWEAAGRYQGKKAPIRDRQLDYILGVPLLLIALFLITITPVLWGTFYWSLRPDVLSFALFVVAGVVLAYGVGWAWRMRVPLLLLLLMWPALYVGAVAGFLNWCVLATDAILGLVTSHLPLGVSQVVQNPAVLSIHTTTGQLIQVSVSTACAGGDGVLGFLLIGGTLMVAVTGALFSRLAWLVAGTLVTFVLNVARIVAIAFLVRENHPVFALGVFHEFIGLFLFGVGLAGMVWLLPAFGLAHRARHSGSVPAAPGEAPTRPPFGAGLSRRRLTTRLAVALVVLGLFVAGDQTLGLYAGFANGQGAPTVAAMGTSSRVPPGWSVSLLATYPWGDEYFGAGSSYVRYQLSNPASSIGEPVLWADVVTTPDVNALQTYTIENCFLFHNYDIISSRTLALSHGVTAVLLNYSDPASHGRWATLSWTWPVRLGGTTAYERIELTADLMPGSAKVPDLRPVSAPIESLVLGVENFFGAAGSRTRDQIAAQYRGADAALASFGVAFVGATVAPRRERI
ncbi:MAG: archaeosortase/exosortase family protein [Candidatus Dormiibacterota bacterium]